MLSHGKRELKKKPTKPTLWDWQKRIQELTDKLNSSGLSTGIPLCGSSVKLPQLSSNTHSLLGKYLLEVVLWMTEGIHRIPFLLTWTGKNVFYGFAVVSVQFLLHNSARNTSSTLPWGLMRLPELFVTLVNGGGQGTAHVNRKGQQCLWWLQWHIPRIILQERNSDRVQKEINFLLWVWTM